MAKKNYTFIDYLFGPRETVYEGFRKLPMLRWHALLAPWIFVPFLLFFAPVAIVIDVVILVIYYVDFIRSKK